MTRLNEALRCAGWWPVAVLVTVLGSAAAQEPTTDCATPRGCVESLHDGLFVLSQQGGDLDVEARFERLEPLIHATHDLAYIGEFSVRRQWASFTAEEQQAFLEAFARLSVMTYASRFDTLSEDTLGILEADDGSDDPARVLARIARGEEPDIPLEYLLRNNGDDWRIVNVIADGVSDLALKRAEYRRILDGGGPSDLIAYLEEQIAGLK